MLIRAASDLHLEFFRQPITQLADNFLPRDDRDIESVLVLAGDITPNISQLRDFLSICCARFLHVIYVPGNHEYYRSEMFEWQKQARAELERLNGLSFALDFPGTYRLNGVRFAFCTLWSDGGDTPEEQAAIGQYLNDFRLIRYGDAPFTVQCMADRHQEQKMRLGGLLREVRPQVVVTHHMPSYSLSHPRFGNVCTGGFAGKCDDMMTGEFAPAVWIHGHTHDTFDRTIGKTRIVCNPAGYYPEWGTLHNNFIDGPKFIEVSE